MEPLDQPKLRLRAQIASLEEQLADPRKQLARAESLCNHQNGTQVPLQTQHVALPPVQSADYREKTYESLIDDEDLSQEEHWRRSWELTPREHKRYGRQLIMPEVGLRGQLRLKNASVLIVGVGGLQLPHILRVAGLGEIGLMDGDTIELSNLHRQLLHTERWLGTSTVDSAVDNLRGRNSEIHYVAYNHNLDQKIAVEVMRKYDLILDCTDRPSTRYLVSDAAVLAEKPVVTASALRTEGQLMVLNNPLRSHNHPGGFCYRCVFPRPLPAESVLSCGEGGILGPVVGVMGVLMAMEALKILLRSASENAHHDLPTGANHPAPSSLLLYSAYSNPPFRSIKLRGKRKGCPSCWDTATITEETFQSPSSSPDYDASCSSGDVSASAMTNTNNRISAKEYSTIRAAATSAAATGHPQHVLVDVRERVQFDICHLKGSINLPCSDIIEPHSDRTIELHGPDHYRQLLEQTDENEILKPNRSKATLKNINRERKNWGRFCREIFGPDINQVERLRNIRLRDIQVYMRWLLDISNMQKLNTMATRMKAWSMMYRDDVGHPLDVNMRFQMNTYYNTTLKNDFKLDPTQTLKESINVDDLYHLLIFLWTRDTHVYPVERQRVQQALITLLIALTTVRPGAIIESSSYYGTNEALLYRDVTLRLVRDPIEPSQTVLLMEVTIRLWKGYREKEKPATFVFYEHDYLIFCPILYFLSPPGSAPKSHQALPDA